MKLVYTGVIFSFCEIGIHWCHCFVYILVFIIQDSSFSFLYRGSLLLWDSLPGGLKVLSSQHLLKRNYKKYVLNDKMPVSLNRCHGFY